MIDVVCSNRWEAKTSIKSGNIFKYNFISISDTPKESSEMESLWSTQKEKLCPHNPCSAIFIHFKDIDSASSGFNDISGGLYDFIGRCLTPDEPYSFYIHCFAGVSRSYAVGKFINDKYELHIDSLSSYKNHNEYVYSQLCSISDSR